MGAYKTVAIVLGVFFLAILIGGVVTGQFARRMIIDGSGSSGSSISIDKVEFYYDHKYWGRVRQQFTSRIFAPDVNGENSSSSQLLGNIAVDIKRDNIYWCDNKENRLITNVNVSLNGKIYRGQSSVYGRPTPSSSLSPYERLRPWCNQTDIWNASVVTGSLMAFSSDGSMVTGGIIQKEYPELLGFANSSNMIKNHTRLYFYGYKLEKI